MYEINLVPDVKAELLKKRRLQYFVIFICIAVAAGCGAILLVLLGVRGGQKLVDAAKDTEIACRADGTGKCNSNYGTPVMKYENLEQLLTIQDQLKNVESLNASKIRYSRVFGILDILLMADVDKEFSETENYKKSIAIEELNTSFKEGVTLSFDARAFDKKNNIGFSVVEAFKKNATKIRFDYGSYMRKDQNTGEFVEIPSYCILEEKSYDGKIVYGTYAKGIPGCELDIIKKVETNKDDDSDLIDGDTKKKEETPVEDGNDIYSYVEERSGQIDTEVCKRDDVECIEIRRTYLDAKDLESYKRGEDELASEEDDVRSGYYFKSACLSYTDTGVDVEASLESCPLLADEMNVADVTQGDDGGVMMVHFSAVVPINRRVFEDRNNHMMILGVNRQNVTDSYVQIRDMFTSGEEGK